MHDEGRRASSIRFQYYVLQPFPLAFFLSTLLHKNRRDVLLFNVCTIDGY